jgi:hypothetical protein
MRVLEFCHVKDVVVNNNPNVISLVMRCNITLRKYFGHGRLPSLLLMGREIYPNAVICCAGVSTNLKTGTKNKYSINRHSSAEESLRAHVHVGPFGVESFIILCQVSRCLNPCSRFLICRHSIISKHNLGNRSPGRICPNK